MTSSRRCQGTSRSTSGQAVLPACRKRYIDVRPTQPHSKAAEFARQGTQGIEALMVVEQGAGKFKEMVGLQIGGEVSQSPITRRVRLVEAIGGKARRRCPSLAGTELADLIRAEMGSGPFEKACFERPEYLRIASAPNNGRTQFIGLA